MFQGWKLNFERTHINSNLRGLFILALVSGRALTFSTAVLVLHS